MRGYGGLVVLSGLVVARPAVSTEEITFADVKGRINRFAVEVALSGCLDKITPQDSSKIIYGVVQRLVREGLAGIMDRAATLQGVETVERLCHELAFIWDRLEWLSDPDHAERSSVVREVRLALDRVEEMVQGPAVKTPVKGQDAPALYPTPGKKPRGIASKSSHSQSPEVFGLSEAFACSMGGPRCP